MYTFEKLTSLSPPMHLQILQVLIQTALHPQQHFLLQIVFRRLVGFDQVPVLLADGWSQNRLPIPKLMVSLLAFLNLEILRIYFFANGSHGVGIEFAIEMYCLADSLVPITILCDF